MTEEKFVPRVPTKLSTLLAFRLIRLADTISRGAALTYERRFGVSNVELRSLIVLSEMQPLSVNELARRASTDKAWVSRAVRSMEDRGLIQRAPHPTDSRISLVSLTQAGHRAVGELAPAAEDRHLRLVGSLDPEALDAMVTELEKNADALLRNP